VKDARRALQNSVIELENFVDDPDNNVFDTVDGAKWELEARFRERAHAACEGSYNYGEATYAQGFSTKDGKHWMFKLEVEYSRHDKTYYYIDRAEATVTEVTDE
jgi:hypothetical protein